eukprot:1193328-Prorocentrum_minimum.AAC.3
MQVGGCNRTVWSLQYRSGWGPPPVESHTRRGQAIRAVIKKNLNIPVMSSTAVFVADAFIYHFSNWMDCSPGRSARPPESPRHQSSP